MQLEIVVWSQAVMWLQSYCLIIYFIFHFRDSISEHQDAYKMEFCKFYIFYKFYKKKFIFYKFCMHLLCRLKYEFQLNMWLQ